MNEENNIQEIERYLSGDMTGAERTAFEARMQADEALRADVMLHQDLDTVLADGDALDFSAMVAEVVAENAPAAGSPRRSGYRNLGIAAAIVLLAMVGFYLLQPPAPADGATLFTEYYAPYEAPAAFRSGDSTLAITYELAFTAYNLENYSSAITSFQAIREANPDDLTARFYLGLSYLAEDQPGAAIQSLEALADMPPHVYRGQSRWYLALAFLKNGQREAARPRLEATAAAGGKFAGDARKLLEEL